MQKSPGYPLLALLLWIFSGCTDLLSDYTGSTFEPDASFSDTLPEGGVSYRNPVIPGCYPDPSVCRAGDDYYLVNSSFEYFPGIPVFHSRDLVNWRQIGHCLTTNRQLDVSKRKSSAGIGAPTLRFHEGVFYVVTTDAGGRGNFFVTAKDPAGPWSDPFYISEAGFDPSLFFDDDGRCYYTSQEGSNRGSHIIQYEIDVASGRLIGEKRFLWEGAGEVWTEGPHLYKINRCYYLMAATGGTGAHHQEIIAASGFPGGPFVGCPANPILSHRNTAEPIQCTGHADLFQDQNGRWWAVFLGMRYLNNGLSMLGRETFLTPVTWNKGWPVFGDNGRVGLAMKGPLPPLSINPEPLIREQFDVSRLPLCYCFVRNPAPGSYSLTERPGWLRLRGNRTTLSDQDAPAFVGRRQQHFAMTARACLSFAPQRAGEEAGLTIRVNERAHYDLTVSKQNGRNEIMVRSCRNDSAVIVGSAIIGDTACILQIESGAVDYAFSYSLDAVSYSRIAVLGAHGINPESTGAFTGAVIGMYASGNGESCTVPADFDWFEYVPR
ncbi:MAG: glycoside hydrolase family 43 protein [Chitinispirillaceae bacterium]|nr:glycoside hydrolase family 43 protein [Chitinispirillaceae bacterium]